MNTLILSTAALLSSLLAALPAQAAANLITNGDFESTTFTSSQQITGTTAATSGVTGWSNTASKGYTGVGYTFLIFPGTADTTGFTSAGGNHDKLWGPGGGTSSSNYSNNGMTPTSPTGGNYILADGDSRFAAPLSQSVSGLTVGQAYALTFNWAAAQFATYSGTTTEAWNVTFGGQSQSTQTVTTPSHGFTPWQQQTMYFVASAVTQTLSFLAVGTPNGFPPSTLLDSVSLVAAPEPATWAVLAVGLVGTGFLVRRRRSAGGGAASQA